MGCTILLAVALILSVGATADPKVLFDKHCANCHDPEREVDGRTSELYPSLFEVARTRSAVQMAYAVLNGKFDRAGERAGVTTPTMPAHDYLANETVADIVNYVRERALVAGRISVETVAAIRGGSEYVALPDLSDSEYRVADELYQYRCAGCHAVDRSGRSGSALYAWAIAAQGGEAAKLTIHFGTPWGMPSWGMQEVLTAEQISLLTRYLAKPSRGLPLFRYEEVVANWRRSDVRPPRHAQRDSVAKIENLFVSLLHDTGQIMLIDGDSREILAVADASIAPSEAIRSGDGRYLYVMSRSSDVVLFDLGVTPVRELARVKTGYEGRSLAFADNGDSLIVGSYWPPQVVQLNAADLEPESVMLIDPDAYKRNRTDAEITQLVALPESDEMLLLTKAAGDYLRVKGARRLLSREHGHPFLRAGSKDQSGRYLLTPADDGVVVVFDLKNKKVVRRLDAQGLIGGAKGIAFKSEDGSNMWATSGLGSGSFFVVETEGEPAAWRTSISFEPAWDGSLNIVSHPQAAGIWVDFPLSTRRQQSQSVAILSKSSKPRMLQIINPVELAGLTDNGLARAVHPQFNNEGTQVWITIWNRQDQTSAIVVLDAISHEVVEVIKDERLITPIRTLSLPYR